MSAKQTVEQRSQKITALYERLSRDDDQIGDSNSIVNQKKYLEGYAEQKGYENIRHYTDDGWSGGNFERPAWKLLISDIEAGKVAHVLVKDMSRIGRDYLQTGFYTEVVFRQHGVHFAAVGNGIDSDDPGSSEFAPFINIMSEWYLRDLSRKQRAAIRVKGESGKPTTTRPIYGYKKDPNDKYHWIVDEEAAAVVRRIFGLAVAGYGPSQTAAILYNDKVEIPTAYAARHGHGPWKNRAEIKHPYNWSDFAVSNILSKPEYMGDTVNFRSHKASYKDKHPVMNPKEEWLIFENTHEAIVERETWHLVQKLRETKRRHDTIDECNPLTGLVFCADCGGKMYNQRSRGDKEKGRPPKDQYECSAYKLARQNRLEACKSHYITTKNLRVLILETIQIVSRFAIENEDEFVKKVRAASEVRQAKEVRALERRINKSKKRADELDVIIKKLYESYATGKIPENRFGSLSSDYEAEQAELKEKISESEKMLAEYADDTENIGQFMVLAKKYTDFSELTTPMINEFVDKIIVHAPERVDGDRVQEVEIYLKFIGRFELPPQELTPEEIKRQEFLKKERARSRERYRQLKSGERVVGVPIVLTCKCCGESFESHSTAKLFCSPKCRAKYYRQEAAEKRSRECVCENCGSVFTTTRKDVKYCSEECRVEAKRVRQKKRNAETCKSKTPELTEAVEKTE